MATILTLNSGSSSLKLGLYEKAAAVPKRLVTGAADAIGRPGGKLILRDGSGATLHEEDAAHESQTDAFTHAAQRLAEKGFASPAGIGFRIVHGGPHLCEHMPITPQVLDTLRASTHFAPLHIPPALQLIDAAHRTFPDAKLFACLDTAFHTTLPPAAFTYAIPPRFREQGVRRYGFHGLSYESIVAALAPSVPARLIVAHLGNGASLCAIERGRSVDTSMGLTPTGGIPMGTRTGDLDPGVVVYLARQGGDSGESVTVDALETMLNHDSGLLALSSTVDRPGTADMRELTTRQQAGDADAELAVAVFCREIAKTVASYAAILGGLDCLVFTGGIGEHSEIVRERVCGQLAFLDVHLDAELNQKNASVISSDSSPVQVHIIPADEDGQIARHVATMLR